MLCGLVLHWRAHQSVLTPNTHRPLLNNEDCTPTNRALAEEYAFLKYVSVVNVPKYRVRAENARVLPE